MKRYCGDAAVSVPKLLMRSSLPYFDEAEGFEDPNDLPRLQSREARHVLGNRDRLDADELGFQAGFAVLEEHRNDLLEIGLELVERFRLTMGAREAGDIADQEAGVGIALDNCCVVPHLSLLLESFRT